MRNFFVRICLVAMTLAAPMAHSSITVVKSDAGDEITLYDTSCLYDQSAGAQNARVGVQGQSDLTVYGCWYDQGDTLLIKWHRLVGRNSMTPFEGQVVVKAPDHLRGSKPSSSAQKRAGQPIFGIYTGEANGLTVGIETTPKGVGLVIVNNSRALLTVKPAEFKIVTTESTVSPCTFHALSTMGVGSPLASVELAPGKREGYMLGACSALTGSSPESGMLRIQSLIKKVVLRNVEINVKPD